MDVSAITWIVTLGLTIAVLAFDVVVIARKPHEPTLRECALALAFYVGAALAFGGWIWAVHGSELGLQFYTGWLVEYSLSMDNLFVFILLMAALSVPRRLQQEALMVGIVLALVFRGVFIALGYQLIENFSFVFYLFGAFLVYTAYRLAQSFRTHEDEHPEENVFIRFIRKHVTVAEEFRGLRMWWHENGVRVVSPMLIVVVALGTTDVMFALDSIPAIFGITREPYLVFTANVFALMGLRQLYFLIGGLLDRLRYLSLGLAVVLAFIGVKLVLHALHENELPFINGGHSVHVPEIEPILSLVAIFAVLTVTAAASLMKDRSDRLKADPGPGR